MHTYEREWSKSATHHWLASTCGHEDQIIAKKPHTWVDTTDKDVPAGETTTGKDYKKCSACDYETYTEIPVTGHIHTASYHWVTSTTHHYNVCSGACDEIYYYGEHEYGAPTYKEEVGVVYAVERCVTCNHPNKYPATNVEIVDSAEEAQLALDNATDGQTIILKAGDYGTLYIRQSSQSVSVDMGNWAGGADVERFRSISNLTIIGEEGAVVNTILVEAQVYAPGSNQHSNSASMPRLSSYIALNDIAIKGVTFEITGQALNFGDGRYSLDGLTFEECNFIAINGSTNARITIIRPQSEKKDVDDVVVLDGNVKNVVLKNNLLEGLYMGIEVNEVENFTATGNVIYDNLDNVFQLNVGANAVITGEIVITDNISDGRVAGRFIRGVTWTDAEVTIAGNVITNGFVDEGSVVKITNSNTSSVLLEDNSWNGATDEDAHLNGLIILS